MVGVMSNHMCPLNKAMMPNWSNTSLDVATKAFAGVMNF